MAKQKETVPNTVTLEYEDFTNGRRLKNAIVINPTSTPVVVNENGQTLGGMKTGKVILSDSVVIGAIRQGLILVLSTA